MSEMTLHVTALNRNDAIDIAKRRARESGYAPQGAARVVSVPGTVDRWAVSLTVVRL